MTEAAAFCGGEASGTSQRPAEFHGHRLCRGPCHRPEIPDGRAAPSAGTGMEEYRPAPFPGNHGQLDHPVFPGLAVSPGQCHEG